LSQIFLAPRYQAIKKQEKPAIGDFESFSWGLDFDLLPLGHRRGAPPAVRWQVFRWRSLKSREGSRRWREIISDSIVLRLEADSPCNGFVLCEISRWIIALNGQLVGRQRCSRLLAPWRVMVAASARAKRAVTQERERMEEKLNHKRGSHGRLKPKTPGRPRTNEWIRLIASNLSFFRDLRLAPANAPLIAFWV